MRPAVLAVIPARGGSEGLPGKNLLDGGGRSLIARAVEAALDAQTVDRVLGSTDDPDIAATMVEAGAEVPWLRPPDLALADTPDPPVFLHALRMLARTGYEPEIVVNVRPTAPLRTGADIDGAVRLLVEHPAVPSVKSVSPPVKHPYKMWSIEADGTLRPLIPEWHDRHGGDPDVARQRLPSVFASDGAVDAVRVRALLDTGRFHPGPVLAYLMDPARSLDVDSREDLLLAEHRLQESVR